MNRDSMNRSRTKSAKTGRTKRTFIILAALLALPIGLTTASSPSQTSPGVKVAEAVGPERSSQRVTPAQAASYGLPNVSEVFERQNEKVVAITAQVPGQQMVNPFFGGSIQGKPQTGQGSGFIIDEDGYILTNNHVIDGASEITVILKDGHSYPAKVIGHDAQTDIALLKIEPDEKLPAVKLGKSKDLKVGQWVVAIGNPFGLDYSVTAGIISAKGRNIGAGPYDNFLQTDASINPGNSGGPLFNMNGEVIGVNTAIRRDGQGIGFAVPIDMVKEMIPALRKRGYVSRGYLGAGIQEMNATLAASFGVGMRQGVLIGSVEPGGPADQAGIRPGDIVTKFNGQPTRDARELLLAVAATQPGEKASADLIRDKKPKRLIVAVAERPDASRAAVVPAKETSSGVVLGLKVSPVTPQLAQRFGATAGQGVIIESVQPTSPVARLLRPGDIIQQVGETVVSSEKELNRAIREHDTRKPLRLLVHRDGRTMYLAMHLSKSALGR
ncbi:Do family serine endopeptidase [Bradymonas sediminis]|uniref:Peptidase n=1 Tax=Bradymonas sediminis TaxID=1548548 RepID=A0A2Z4FMZ8_9DELT|nr:Do family serine endopeptidase [Bradymonas sediminis]AWV90205.1 peptidase [Bradymonas sediminis]TDP75827.1 serine protease Do [Bradymonas sediminis]